MPHTKQQLQQLLAQAGKRLRHRWGQNFLIDLNLMRLLVDAAELTGGETVLEVGCGTGSMTQLLAAQARTVVAVEIDPALAALARQEVADYPNVEVICTDVLARKSALAPPVTERIAAAQRQCPGRLVMVANLPYQVAAPLMIDLLLEPAAWVDGMFVTVQAEVAQRMVAAPATKAYGPLSILLQAAGQVAVMRRIKPQAFWPAPRVNSAMVAWRRHRAADGRRADAALLKQTNVTALKQLVDLFLRHRRKKIRTCLAESPGTHRWAELLHQAGIDPDARGETLTVAQYVALAHLVSPGAEPSLNHA